MASLSVIRKTADTGRSPLGRCCRCHQTVRLAASDLGSQSVEDIAINKQRACARSARANQQDRADGDRSVILREDQAVAR
jgi:hypothetical protein